MEAWTHSREFVSRHVAPINTVVFGTTGIVIPLFDFIRPQGPFLIYAAVVMGSLFAAALIAVRWKRWLRLPTALVIGLGISAALFTVAATASHERADRGGVLVSALPSLQPLQDVLLGLHADVQETNRTLKEQGHLLADIRSGKSDDPRVALRNMGIAWEYGKLRDASKAGDLRVMELFLAGGMSASELHGTSLAWTLIQVRAPHTSEQLALLERYGVDLHGAEAVSGEVASYVPPTLYVAAVQSKNDDAQRYLLAHGSTEQEYDRWAAAQKKGPRESGYWF